MSRARSPGWPGAVAAVWGIGGVLGLLVFAIWRLSTPSLDAMTFQWGPQHWVVMIANLLFMGYSEGYRGFQRSYSPRVVARARYLLQHWTPLWLISAPLFCMGYFHTTRRRKIAAWLLTVMIVVLIIVFRQLPQPWRGILDAGVVVGLTWGAVSIAVFAGKLLSGGQFDSSPELPG